MDGGTKVCQGVLAVAAGIGNRRRLGLVHGDGSIAQPNIIQVVLQLLDAEFQSGNIAEC